MFEDAQVDGQIRVTLPVNLVGYNFRLVESAFVVRALSAKLHK